MAEYHKINATKHGKSYTNAYHNWYKYKDHVDISIDDYIKLEDKARESGKVVKLIDDKLVIMGRGDASRIQRMRSDNTSGYTGVYYNKIRNWWYWQLTVNGINVGENCFATAEEAMLSRELYIVEHNIKARRNT